MSTQGPWDGMSPQPPQRKNSNQAAGRGCLVLILGILAVGVVVGITNSNSGSNGSASPASDGSASPYTAPSTYTAPTTDSAIGVGDCLSVDGAPPTESNTTVDVSNITKVDCTDSSAQYKVIGVEPFSTDLNSCTTDYPDSTFSLLDQGPYISDVYCVVSNS